MRRAANSAVNKEAIVKDIPKGTPTTQIAPPVGITPTIQTFE